MTGGVKKNQNDHFFVENAKNKNIQLCVLHQLTAVCFYFFNFQQKKAHFDFFLHLLFLLTFVEFITFWTEFA